MQAEEERNGLATRDNYHATQGGSVPKAQNHVPQQTQTFIRSSTNPAMYARGWQEAQYAVPASSMSGEMAHSTCMPKSGISWMPSSSGYYFPRGGQPYSMAGCCTVPQGSTSSGSMLTPLFSKICRPTAYHAPKPKDDTAIKKQPMFMQGKDHTLVVSSHSAFQSTHGCAIQV